MTRNEQGIEARVAALEAALDAMAKEVRTERVVVVRRGEEVIKLETSGSEQGEAATIVVNAPGRRWRDNLLLSAWTWHEEDGSTKADISVELHKDEHLAGNWSTLEGIEARRVTVVDEEGRKRVEIGYMPTASSVSVIAPGKASPDDEDTTVDLSATFNECVDHDLRPLASASVSLIDRGFISVLADAGDRSSLPSIDLEQFRGPARRVLPTGDDYDQSNWWRSGRTADR